MISCRRCFLAAPLSLPRISGPTLPPPLQLRSTRGALSDVSGSGGQGVQLGVSGEPFTFESHARARGVKVATATVSGGCSTQSINQDQFSAGVSGALAADAYAHRLRLAAWRVEGSRLHDGTHIPLSQASIAGCSRTAVTDACSSAPCLCSTCSCGQGRLRRGGDLHPAVCAGIELRLRWHGVAATAWRWSCIVSIV